ncbi:MAG: DUF4249 family protein [Tenuifilaceae bacterium]|jgi:hypothetical protein|nr:DUF4249 family protein [Tenuifilaceae bacterium]
MKTKHTLLVYLFTLSLALMAILMGCRTKIDWYPPEFEQKPVLSSVIKAGSPITIKVSLAVTLSSEPTPEVNNADVVVFVDNVLTETLKYIGDGLYQSEQLAQEGSEYRCEITIPGYPTAMSITRIPTHMNIISVDHLNKAWVDEEGVAFPSIKLTFANKPESDVYYQVVINLFRYGDDISTAWLKSIVDPILLNEGLPIAVFSNKFISENAYTMTINYSTGSAMNSNGTGWVAELYPLQVELRTICPNYYKFIKQQYLYELANSEPFLSVGVTGNYKLHSNVQNGYGIVVGYSSVKSEIIDPNN